MSHDIAVIGNGCAALSLAAKAEQLPDYNLTLIRPNGAPKSKDHVWGFWSDETLEDAVKLAKGTWHQWAVITPKKRTIMSSTSMPYNAIKRSDWTAHCQSLAQSSGVRIIDQEDWQKENNSTVFDTRPPVVPDECILQHFHGLEIKTNTPVFQANTAILMDFRVDQSKGMHFIYLLPYSTTEALVESTIFSTDLADEQFYLSTIDNYLAQHYQVEEYEITHRENGVIPLGKLAPHDVNIPGLGANGGATRPASGYAFLFIQRQITSAIERVNAGKELTFSNPHKRLDLWMDSVLLTVLRHWPQHGPNLFSSMARTLTGDQFVKFLSGDAGWWIRLKVIFSMPKIPFLKALTKRAFTRKKVSTAVVA
ncbi:MAG: lycopene cyclase family protein [Candidatus Poseidoniaceae archaeon]|nr:lycopene cyclase family protein [Candidatus Poseidoniaceae archaeon]